MRTVRLFRRRTRGAIAVLALFSLVVVVLGAAGVFAVAARANRQSQLQDLAEMAALAGADKILVDGLPAATAAPPEIVAGFIPADVQSRWSFGEQPDARHAYAWVELTGGDARLRSFLAPRPVTMRARAFVDEERLGTTSRSLPTSPIMQCTQRDRLGRCTRTERVACTIPFGRPPGAFHVFVAGSSGESVVTRGAGTGDTRGNNGSLRWLDGGSSLELSLRLCGMLDGGNVLRLRWGPSTVVAAGEPGALTLPSE
jgi:hypothetical protein